MEPMSHPEPSERLLDRRAALLLVAVTLVAFAVRTFWVTWVQPPDEAVFSDMRSYFHQALMALGYERVREPANMVLFPWGVHSWYATLLALFGPPDWGVSMGRTGWTGEPLILVALAAAATNASVASFAFLATLETTRRRSAATIAGLCMALWPPLTVFCGFFTSETPFAACVAASLWLSARTARTGRHGWAAGLALAVGATMRPQMLLTAGLTVLWMGVLALRRRAVDGWTVVSMVVPLVLVIGFSTARFYAYTGDVALVSANGELARLFAVSDYHKVANRQGHGFHPPARLPELGFDGIFVFDGDWLDEAQFTVERKRIWNTMGWVDRGRVLTRNVGLLFARNPLWPERNAVRYAREAGVTDPESRQWRQNLLPWHERIVWPLLPLSLVGLARSARRNSAGVQVALLQLFTMLFSAAFYFGESRYRVPYDAVLVLLAVCALAPPPATPPAPDRRMWGVVAVALALVVWMILPR